MGRPFCLLLPHPSAGPERARVRRAPGPLRCALGCAMLKTVCVRARCECMELRETRGRGCLAGCAGGACRGACCGAGCSCAACASARGAPPMRRSLRRGSATSPPFRPHGPTRSPAWPSSFAVRVLPPLSVPTSFASAHTLPPTLTRHHHAPARIGVSLQALCASRFPSSSHCTEAV